MTQLDFVIIGAQRAGTSYLNACLRDHPGLYLCPDEVPYFEDPFFATTPPSALAPVFARARPGQALGIQRPDYLAREECAARIRLHSPDARALAVLRDPVSRAISAYFWYTQFGLLPLEPIDVGFERLLSGTVDPAYPRAKDILDYGLYGRHLSHWFAQFGRDQVLVLLSQDLRRPETFRHVYGFLGVDPDLRSRPLRPANAGVYDQRRLRVLRLRRRLAWSWDGVTTYHYRPRRLRRPLLFVPNAAIVTLDRVVLSRLFGNDLPRLSPDLEARLRAVYAADGALLESLLGRDFTGWRRVASPPPSA